ncbi:hypothetical protein BH10ACI3_BH10ACI3_18930 [soil metagenome]
MKNELRFTFSFICLVVMGLFTTAAMAQAPGDRNRPAGRGTYRISGKVFLSNGEPAVSVTVDVSGAETNGESTRTDTEGAFTISGLSSGNYTVAVREKGYQLETDYITIPEGATSGQAFRTTIYLRLPGQAKGAAKSFEKPANPNTAGVPKNAAAKYEKALDLITKDDPKGAIAVLDEAIAGYPNFAAAYYEKGASLLKLKDLDKAVEAFVKAISLKPDYLEAKYGYGMAMFEKKNYEVSEAAFRDVLKQKSDFAEAHLNLGISLFYLKNPAGAATELKAAIASKGGDKLALGHLYLGQIYMQKKENREAIFELQKYLELAPKAPNADRIRTAIEDLKKQS